MIVLGPKWQVYLFLKLSLVLFIPLFLLNINIDIELIVIYQQTKLLTTQCALNSYTADIMLIFSCKLERLSQFGIDAS